MRTGLFLLSGFLLLAVFAILGKMFAANYPSATTTAVVAFVVLWVPAVAAVLLKWKFL